MFLIIDVLNTFYEERTFEDNVNIIDECRSSIPSETAAIVHDGKRNIVYTACKAHISE